MGINTDSVFGVKDFYISRISEGKNPYSPRNFLSDLKTKPLIKCKQDSQYKLEETVYNYDKQIHYKRYRNDKNETKTVYYFNNKPIKEWNNDGSVRSLIKDNFKEFISKNVNPDNLRYFLETYGNKEFITDLFINDKLDNKTKNQIFKDIFALIDKKAQSDLERFGIHTDTDREKRILIDIKNEYIPDGDFEGKFGQGSAGDCVILGRIIAVLAKPKGKQAIKNLVESDGNGNLTITFNALNTKVKVSYDEFTSEKYRSLSRGNADVKVLEIAWDKLTKYIGGVNNPLSNIAFDTALLGFSSQGIPNPMYLTPSPIGLEKKLLKYYYKSEFNSPDKAYVMGLNALNFLFRIGIHPTTEDGREMTLKAAHEYAILRADDEYVYLRDPEYSGQNLRLKWKDFNRLSFILSEIRL